MIRGVTVFAAMLVLAASGASAKDEDNSQTAEAAKEKKICKTEKVTGSLTRVRRTCLTQREWDRLSELTRKGVEGLERDANQSEGLRNNSFRGPGG